MPLVGTFAAGSVGGFGQRKVGLGPPISIEYLLVGGGGAGGGYGGFGGGSERGGGGGGGGLRTASGFTIYQGAEYTITVGAGGSSSPGGDSSIAGDGILDLVATGGGHGGGTGASGGQSTSGGPGGAGGGAQGQRSPPTYLGGGVGNSPSNSPSQGEMVELLLLLTHQVEEFVTALVAAEAADLLAEMDL